jgi:hypothetical protein
METSLRELIDVVCEKFNVDKNKVLKECDEQIQAFLNEYEDPDIHLRCKGKNKNGKRCSKSKKENSEFCSVHYNQHKEKDNDFIPSEKAEKADKADDTSSSASSGLQIIDAKKKGILPEKIKKIMYDSKKYYINKNDWVYEMNQDSEIILSDIPIGKMFSGKLVVLKLD